MIIDYIIVDDDVKKDFIGRVQQLVSDGYEPLGGVSVNTIVDSDGIYNRFFTQAMIKRDDHKHD